MDKQRMKANWKVIKGNLKQKYANLTDDDLKFADGKEDELIGKLQKKLGKAKDEIMKEINEMSDK